ncbi:hypothetical protein [Halobacillus salinus]|uniref:Uncharacterized protein n=1 Tax=Halobacillus salinus TaxID=192814 RepID=A0A4Z0H610_9BACI|nr:hypothetical protein [Halobacillus salinus]TGB04851.1 hypothetical protein E4663_07615 [Halobacillus salinus]
MVSGIIHNALIIIHALMSIFGLLAANASEKSIITDRVNKYLFMIISLLYSFFGVGIVYGLIISTNWSDKMKNVQVFGMVLSFLFIQILVYRVLNHFDITEE